MSKQLPLTEELDFHYLLGLMPPLKDVPEFAWLPELFSIVGHERLVKLCQFAGGETIKIPTIKELVTSVEALQLFYDSVIQKKQLPAEVDPEAYILMEKVKVIYDARDREERNSEST